MAMRILFFVNYNYYVQNKRILRSYACEKEKLMWLNMYVAANAWHESRKRWIGDPHQRSRRIEKDPIIRYMFLLKVSLITLTVLLDLSLETPYHCVLRAGFDITRTWYLLSYCKFFTMHAVAHWRIKKSEEGSRLNSIQANYAKERFW